MRIVTLDDARSVHATLVRIASEGIHETTLGPLTDSARAGWAAIIASVHPVFGQDAYATLSLKSARLLCGGATTQHLMDGNKRLSTAVMHEQLAINGGGFVRYKHQ